MTTEGHREGFSSPCYALIGMTWGRPLYRNSLNCIFMTSICSLSQHSVLKEVLNEDRKSRHRDFEFSKAGCPSTQDSPGVPDSKT